MDLIFKMKTKRHEPLISYFPPATARFLYRTSPQSFTAKFLKCILCTYCPIFFSTILSNPISLSPHYRTEATSAKVTNPFQLPDSMVISKFSFDTGEHSFLKHLLYLTVENFYP